MQVREIEAWTFRVVDAVSRGDKHEDSTVEMKADWPTDHADVARRIAGHANAARGVPVLWLIGLDEKQGVTSRTPIDHADWWAQVARNFDEVAPPMQDIVVAVGEGKTVVALCFESDRAPYVVKNSAGGKIQREIPWREGTALRSARRSDLLRVLVPLQTAPRLSIESASLSIQGRPNTHTSEPPGLAMRFDATLYFTAGPGGVVVFPHRGQIFTLEPLGISALWTMTEFGMAASNPLPFNMLGAHRADERVRTIHDGVDQLIVDGHGYAWAWGHGRVPLIADQMPNFGLIDDVRLTVELFGVELPSPTTATEVLHPSEIEAENIAARWVYRSG